MKNLTLTLFFFSWEIQQIYKIKLYSIYASAKKRSLHVSTLATIHLHNQCITRRKDRKKWCVGIARGPWDVISFLLLSNYLHAVNFKQYQVAVRKKLSPLTAFWINLSLIRVKCSITKGPRMPFWIIHSHFNTCLQD